MSYTLSKSIKSNATAAEVRSAIVGYYSAFFGSDIVVNKTMYMANGTNTTNATLGTTHVFFVRLRKLINGVSATNALIAKATSSSVTVELADVI